MPQEDNDVGSVDRMIEVPLVDLPDNVRATAVDTSRRLLTSREESSGKEDSWKLETFQMEPCG